VAYCSEEVCRQSLKRSKFDNCESFPLFPPFLMTTIRLVRGSYLGMSWAAMPGGFSRFFPLIPIFERGLRHRTNGEPAQTERQFPFVLSAFLLSPSLEARGDNVQAFITFCDCLLSKHNVLYKAHGSPRDTGQRDS
jgi:hypothetical protein